MKLQPAPDPEQQECGERKRHQRKAGEEVVKDAAAKPPASLELPPVSPPSTKIPVQFNQQVNVYQQIPPSAWDRLEFDQIVELSRKLS